MAFFCVLSLLFTRSLFSQSINQLVLVNAATGADIGLLTQGYVLDLANYAPDEFSIRAETAPATVGSVRFGLNGNANFQTETTPPYTLAGDNNGTYTPWTPSVGTQSLTVTPFDGAGNAGTALSLTFDVVDNSPPPPPQPGCGTAGNGTASLSGELRSWHKLTLDFDGPGSTEDCTPNPFLDYRLEVTFTHAGSGTSYRVPGYFAADGQAHESSATGGHIWRCHFAPDQPGSWTWTASFRTGTDVAIDLAPNAGTATAFDGAQGSFQVLPTNKTGRDHRGKGRLEYVGQRYLRHAETGEYFLKGGADAPENLLAYNDFDLDVSPTTAKHMKDWTPHVGDWQPGDPEWQGGKGHGLIGALNYLAGKGMNVFSFLTMNIGGDDKNVFPYRNHNKLASPQDDRLRFDVSKLAQWEIVFEHADKLGLYLHFKTQETENDQLLDGGDLGRERKLYYRELVARFGHHLALNWNLGEENDIWDELSDPQNTRIQDYAGYLRSIDPYGHHIVLHSYPGHHDESYGPLLGNSGGLSGLSVQTQWNRVHRDTKKWVEDSEASGHAWVVANDEQGSASYGVPPDMDWPGYTHPNNCPTQEEIRDEVLWGNLMAGGAGVEYYFGYSLPHSDLSCEDFRSRDQMWDYTRYALEFFRNLPFTEMESRDDLVSDGYCFAKNNEWYAVYRPAGSSPTLDLPAGQSFESQWYNPRTGAYTNGPLLGGGNNVNLGSPPSQAGEDWVQLVTLQGATFPVELTRFEAQAIDGQVRLQWETAREENSAFFQVERSQDGQLFQPLGRVTAAGNSNGARQYVSWDAQPPSGWLFYRLKLVDLDGSFDYSAVRSLTLGESSLRWYPNPVREALELVVPAGVAAGQPSLSLHLYDLHGQQLHSQSFERNGKRQLLQFALPTLPPGFYHFQVRAGTELLLADPLMKE